MCVYSTVFKLALNLNIMSRTKTLKDLERDTAGREPKWIIFELQDVRPTSEV
jgi:hypothetical protein